MYFMQPPPINSGNIEKDFANLYEYVKTLNKTLSNVLMSIDSANLSNDAREELTNMKKELQSISNSKT